MNFLEKYRVQISVLCKQHKVKTLYAFGSVLTPRFNSASDIDLVVDFKKLGLNEYSDNYFSLKFSLENMMRRDIDLLEEIAITNPYFRENLESTRQLIYAD